MLCKKSLGKVYKIWNNLIICICPKAGEFKTIAGFLTSPALAAALLLNMGVSGGIAIVLSVCTVGNHENLHIRIHKGRRRPKSYRADSG